MDMRRASLSILLFVAAVHRCPASTGKALAETTLSVDWGEPHQTIVGFGGTMGWIHPHPRQRKKVFDLLFTELGASVLRIRALGGEGGDELSLEPENDNDDPRRFDWPKFPIKTTEAKNAIIIKAAIERGVKTVIAAPWSPPAWMKDTGRRAGGGSLKPELVEEYAELWAAYVLGMKRVFGIDIPYISIQNEPDMPYYYPTCRFRPEFYATVMGAVIRRLKKDGLQVRVVGPDTCRIYNMPDYVAAIEKAGVSPGSPILTHLYDLSIPYDRVDRDPERWQRARALASRHKRALWLMETANYLSYGTEKGSYEEALIWAQKIHHALVAGGCEVVCYWSLFFDKRGEALIYSAKSEDERYEVTPKFYTSMNYYRFVRPGMVRYTARSSDSGILVSAFRARGRAGRKVVVAINPTKAAKAVRIASDRDGRWSRYVTSPAKKCIPEGRTAGHTAVELPALSVTTLVTEKETTPP